MREPFLISATFPTTLLRAPSFMRPSKEEIPSRTTGIGWRTKQGNDRQESGGERGIRTLDTGLSPYNALAGRPLRPLGHLSVCSATRCPAAGISPDRNRLYFGICDCYAWSSSKALCSTRTASSVYFS